MTIAPPLRPSIIRAIPGTRWDAVIRRMRWGYRVHIEDGEYHQPVRWWVLIVPLLYTHGAWWCSTAAGAFRKAIREASR